MKLKDIKPKMWINILLIILLLVFILQNLDTHYVKFLFIQFNLPIFVIIAVSFLVGYLTAIFASPGSRKPEIRDFDKEEDFY
jgi:uncharacterized integral membrane protein